MFLNPNGNARLLAVALFSRLATESQEYLERSGDFSKTVTYQVAMRLVRERVPAGAKVFQFKLGSIEALQNAVFVSGVHEVDAC